MKAKKFPISNPGNSKELKDRAQFYQSTINQMDGINSIRVDPYAENITVDYDETKVSEKEIQKKLEENNLM